MNEAATPSAPPPARPFPLITAVVLSVLIVGCGVYANLSFAVTDPANYKWFPPFVAHSNENHNRHLGAEYLNIAKAMLRGEGFASPFGESTGPTAWMPPLLPCLLAGLLWVFEKDLDSVMAVMVHLQLFALIASGILILCLARTTTTRLWMWVAALMFFIAAIDDFHMWFQFTHDCWLVLLALDIVVAGAAFFSPLASRKSAAIWGAVGGFCGLMSPISGFSWGVVTLATGIPKRAWTRLGVAIACAGIVLAPWAIRNYLVFGRLIPVKSNAAYELYQSQVLTPDGLLLPRAFGQHPYVTAGRERQEYKKLGEIEFLDKKRARFWEAVQKDPEDFLDRVAWRFLGATLWYVPFDRAHETRRPVQTWLMRAIHPLPFLALLALGYSAFWTRLQPAQWVVIGVYLAYLAPYIAISYYTRYAVPLLAVKVLLVAWGVDRLLWLLPSWRREAVFEVVDTIDDDAVEVTS